MPRLRRTLATLAAATAAVVGAAPAASAACGGAGLPASSLAEPQIEESIICLINDQRAASGLQPVWPNAQLRAAGLVHSNEMVSQGFFAHTSPSGLDFVQRITQAGYTAAAGIKSWVVGENLGWGSGKLSTPAAIVEAWMNSPPHRANVLRARFREVGVAAVKGTPVNASDPNGVTVSSEYGFRGKKAKKKKKRRKK
jgi:uncharacterized protein YkwD